MLGGGGGGGGSGGGGGGDGDGEGDGESFGERMWILEGFSHQLNPSPVPQAVGTSGGEGRLLPHQQQRVKEERVPQWSQQETRDLIAIRADLERDSTVARRKRTLWEAVAAEMRERGYRRTPDQCKCKWKNLVNSYKGKETADPEIGQRCPFFEELNAVFIEREKNMQRLLLESEAGTSQSEKKLKRPGGGNHSDDFNDDDNEKDKDSNEEHPPKSRKKKGDNRGGKAVPTSSIQELLHEFLQQQQQMELQWNELMERKAQERRMFEQEWRRSMEKLERERLMLEQAWREGEAQRRMREENRAETRDAALTTLLNRLIQDDL